MKKKLLLSFALLTAGVTGALAVPPGTVDAPDGFVRAQAGAKNIQVMNGISQAESAELMLEASNAETPGARTLTPRSDFRAPQRTSLSGAAISGWMGGVGDDLTGWYTVDTDGTYKMKWAAPDAFQQMGITLSGGWVKNGRLCGLATITQGGLILYYNYVEFDLATGKFLKEEPVTPDNLIHTECYYVSSVYVPAENRIYGYTYNEEGNALRFCSSPADDLDNVTILNAKPGWLELTTSICYNPEENAFFGINRNEKFVKIDRQGNQTELMDVPATGLSASNSGLIYSPLDGCYIFNAVYYHYCSQMYYLYPESKTSRFICNYSADQDFTFFVSDDVKYDASAPGRPVLVSYGLNDGALSGDIVYTLPSVTGGGAALTGQLDWTLYVDNRAYKTGKAEAGTNVTVRAESIDQGLHVFRFAASTGGKEGLSCVISRYVGNGKPLAPESVTLTAQKVTWDAVTKADLDGYLELSNLQYDVYVNGKFMGTTDKTELAVTLDAAAPVQPYYAEVSAKCNGMASDRARSNKLIYGAPESLPYEVVPTREQAEICHIIDADNGPEYGRWEFSEARWHEPVFASGWSAEPSDDWLIMPPVNCDDITKAYRVSIDAACGGMTGKDERFEVWAGTEPTVEAMKTLVIPETSVSEFMNWKTFSNIFAAPAAGPVYVAVRCVSPGEQYSLIVRKIKIEKTDEATAVPSLPTDIKVTGKSDENLTVTVSMKLPETLITGAKIDADAEMKGVLRVGETRAEQAGKPGETVTVTVASQQGNNIVEAFASLNGQDGQAGTVSVFTGTIPPNYVENFKGVISEDNMSVKLTWEPPVRGQENLEGYYSPEGMSYWLYEVKVDQEYGESEWVPTKELGNVLEYTYEVPAGSRQGMHYIGIIAANKAGQSRALRHGAYNLGTLYNAPATEDFIGSRGPVLHYTPLIVLSSSGDEGAASWEWVQPEAVNPDYWNADTPYAMIAYADAEEGGRGQIELPKFSIKDVQDPAFSLKLWNSNPRGNVNVYVSGHGSERYKHLYEVPVTGKGWSTVQVAIPEEYQKLAWLQFAIDATLPDYDTYVLVGGYGIGTKDDSGVRLQPVAEGKVFGGKGMIGVTGFSGADVAVYTVDGALAARHASISDYETISLGAGIYIVNCGGRTFKVVVR